MFKKADIGPIRPEGHPRMYVRSMAGEDQVLMTILEGMLARLTHKVLTILNEQIPVIMQEFVVGIPSIWIRLMRRVARAVLVYI